MDALRMPAVDHPRSADDLVVLQSEEVSLAPRMKTALGALLQSLEYAHDLGSSPWDFALEIASLRRLKLSNVDLRWLLVRGLVEHAIEITHGRDAHRSFHHSDRPLFSKRSCFVLTPSGAQLAHELRGNDEPLEPCALSTEERDADRLPPAAPRTPHWDRDRRELYFGSAVAKRFTLPAIDQESILAAFEEQHWPAQIDDPLPVGDERQRKSRLQEAIHLLNRSLRRPLVRFLLDASGTAVSWEPCPDPGEARHERVASPAR
jgi:hypothetical protein